jgi:methionyl-tRNA formyltransferase
MSDIRFAFAGDRDIAVWVLRFILEQNVQPLALLVSAPERASHAEQLVELCPFLRSDEVLCGTAFRDPSGLILLEELKLDYLICIHFPYLIPRALLSIPKFGVLNLHPGYLPYNRGWHTPIWAMLEGTPIGATLHFMDRHIDTGDIVHQKPVNILPGDTANTLYQRIKKVELQVFKEAWQQLLSKSFVRRQQDLSAGTTHERSELFCDEIQRIDLDERVKAGDLLRRLRALTTNRLDESAYYELEGRRYRVQLLIYEEPIAKGGR